MKSQWANALVVGKTVDAEFLCLTSERRTGSGARGPWVLSSMTLSDRTGSVAAAWFNGSPEPQAGLVYRVKGSVGD